MSDGENSRYFSISESVDEFKDSFGLKEKSVAGLKIVGKGLFNVGKFTFIEILPAVAEKTANKMLQNGEDSLRNNNISSDEKQKIRENMDRAKQQIEWARDHKEKYASKSEL